MTAVSLVIAYGAGRVPAVAARELPIEQFPNRLGNWTAGPDQPVDPDVRQKLATATILSRTYSNGDGPPVAAMLITAKSPADFHDPNECLSGSGWNLGTRGTVVVDGQTINTMVATRRDEQLDVWYCWMSALDFDRLDNSGRRLQSFRRAVFAAMGRKDDVSLFVRLMAPHGPAGNPDIRNFFAAALPSIRRLWTPGAVRAASEPAVAIGSAQ
jgi:hypothetical protein